MSSAFNIADEFAAFLEAGLPEFRYPLCENVEIPTKAEAAFAHALQKAYPIRAADAQQVNLNPKMRGGAYYLACFAVRMAILAARTNSEMLLRSTFVCLMIDDDMIDYRDVLVALSVVENCAARLGIDFRSLVDDCVEIAGDERRDTVLNDYLPRSLAWRCIEIMGFYATGSGTNLTFARRMDF